MPPLCSLRSCIGMRVSMLGALRGSDGLAAETQAHLVQWVAVACCKVNVSFADDHVLWCKLHQTVHTLQYFTEMSLTIWLSGREMWEPDGCTPSCAASAASAHAQHAGPVVQLSDQISNAIKWISNMRIC